MEELFRLFGTIALNFGDAISDLTDLEDRGRRTGRGIGDDVEDGARRGGAGIKSFIGGAVDVFGKIGLAANGIGLIATPIIDFVKGGIQGVREGEEAVSQLDTVIKSTGNAAGVSRDKLIEFANGIQETTRFSAENVNESQKLLLTFTKIGAKDGVFNQATQAALDMATTLKTDVSSASMLVGKALNDPIKGLSALSRSGVQFSAEQKETIKTMVKMGDTAGAQKIILKELETQFGGSAKAAGETFAGKMTRVQNALGEMAEEIAAKVIPYIDKFMVVVMANMPRIQRFVEIAANAIGKALTIVGGLLDAVAKLLDGDFTGAWKAIQGVISNVWNTILPILKAGADKALDVLKAIPGQLVGIGANIIQGLIDGVTGQLTKLRDTVVNVANSAVGWFKGALVIQSPSKRTKEEIGKPIAEGVAKGIAENQKLIEKAIADAVEALFDKAEAVANKRFGDGVAATVSAVERTSGAFVSQTDAINKLLRAGVTLTDGLLAALEERFPRVTEVVIELDEAYQSLQETMFGSQRAIDLTISSIERSEGSFTSFVDAVNKLTNAGVTLTDGLLKTLRERFPEITTAATATTAAVGSNTEAVVEFAKVQTVASQQLERATQLYREGERAAIDYKPPVVENTEATLEFARVQSIANQQLERAVQLYREGERAIIDYTPPIVELAEGISALPSALPPAIVVLGALQEGVSEFSAIAPEAAEVTDEFTEATLEFAPVQSIANQQLERAVQLYREGERAIIDYTPPIVENTEAVTENAEATLEFARVQSIANQQLERAIQLYREGERAAIDYTPPEIPEPAIPEPTTLAPTVSASFNLDGANAAVAAFRAGVLQTDEELQAAQGTILNTIALIRAGVIPVSKDVADGLQAVVDRIQATRGTAATIDGFRTAIDNTEASSQSLSTALNIANSMLENGTDLTRAEREQLELLIPQLEAARVAADNRALSNQMLADAQKVLNAEQTKNVSTLELQARALVAQAQYDLVNRDALLAQAQALRDLQQARDMAAIAADGQARADQAAATAARAAADAFTAARIALQKESEAWAARTAALADARQQLSDIMQPQDAYLRSLDEILKKYPELAAEVEALRTQYMAWIKTQADLKAAAEAEKVAIANKRAAIDEFNANLEKQANEQKRIYDMIANAAIGVFSKITSLIKVEGAGVQEAVNSFVGGIQGGLGALAKGDWIGAIVSVVAGAINAVIDLFNGAAQSLENFKKLASSFSIVELSSKQVSRGWFADIFGGPATVAVLSEFGLKLAKTLESGVLSGLGNGIKAFFSGGNIIDGLRSGIRDAIIGAITEAVVAGAILKGALGKLLEGLAAALSEGNFASAQGFIKQIGAAIPELSKNLESVLAPLRTTLDAALPTNAPTALTNMDTASNALVNSVGVSTAIAVSSAPDFVPRLENAAGLINSAANIFSGAAAAISTDFAKLRTEGIAIRLTVDGLARDFRG